MDFISNPPPPLSNVSIPPFDDWLALLVINYQLYVSEYPALSWLRIRNFNAYCIQSWPTFKNQMEIISGKFTLLAPPFFMHSICQWLTGFILIQGPFKNIVYKVGQFAKMRRSIKFNFSAFYSRIWKHIKRNSPTHGKLPTFFLLDFKNKSSLGDPWWFHLPIGARCKMMCD